MNTIVFTTSAIAKCGPIIVRLHAVLTGSTKITFRLLMALVLSFDESLYQTVECFIARRQHSLLHVKRLTKTFSSAVESLVCRAPLMTLGVK